MHADNIDDVVRLVGDVVDQARAAGHRRGYFAAIYFDMTRAVQEGIARGAFDDGPRMSRLAATFANRYFDALDTFAAGGKPSRVWAEAFACNARRDRLILQQLVIGINAHINLDLGVAAAETVAPGHIEELKGDFGRINAVIGGLLDPVQEAVGRFSPVLDLLWTISDGPDDEVLNFSFTVAREEAWQNAVVLSGQAPEQRAATIQSIDRAAALLARQVIEPGGILGMTVSLVGHIENDDPPAVIDALASIVLPV